MSETCYLNNDAGTFCLITIRTRVNLLCVKYVNIFNFRWVNGRFNFSLSTVCTRLLCVDLQWHFACMYPLFWINPTLISWQMESDDFGGDLLIFPTFHRREEDRPWRWKSLGTRLWFSFPEAVTLRSASRITTSNLFRLETSIMWGSVTCPQTWT